MRAPILDQPSIGVADGHVEKVDRYHGDDRSIWTVDIVHGKERIDDRHIGLDEADPVVGERRLRVAVDGLLRLGTEVLHHCDPPLQKVTSRRHERSIFGEYGCSDFGILLNEGLSKGYLRAHERPLRLEPEALAEPVAPMTSVYARNAKPTRCIRPRAADLCFWGAESMVLVAIEASRCVREIFISFSIISFLCP
jgi:hypothetical protein